MPRRRRLPRCTYCNSPGLGDPPLCRRHYLEIHYGTEPVDEEDDVIGEIIDEVMDHPRVEDLFSRIGKAFDRWTSRLDRPEFAPHYRGRHAGYGGEWPPSPGGPPPPPPPGAPPPPPPPDPPRPALEDPRLVLGFPAQSRPSEAEIRQRRRQLAAIVHPDKGGSTEAVQRINVAADQLIAELWAA